MQKNRDMKDSVRAWQQYADRQKPNQKPKGATRVEDGSSALSGVVQSDDCLPHMPLSPRSISSVVTPFQHAHRGHTSPAPGVPLSDPEAGSEVALVEENLHLSSDVPTPRANERPGTAHSDVTSIARLDRIRRHPAEANAAPSSSQTTVDEVPDQLNRRSQVVLMDDADDADDADDLPQVVLDRSLKRKRGQQSRIEVYTGRSSDGTPAKPHRIKDEPLSSPPPAVHVLVRTETIDLDDPAANNHVPNPLQRTSSMHSNTTGTIRHQRSGSAPFSQQLSDLEMIPQKPVPRSRISDVRARLQTASAEMRALSEPTNPHGDGQVLQPLDPNTVAQLSERTPNKRLKPVATRRVEYDTFAESGEASPPTDEDELRLPPSAARARLQRLRAAKDPQTPINRLQYQPTSGSPLVKQEQMSSSPASISRPAQPHAGLSGSRQPEINTGSKHQEDIVPDGRPVWSMRPPEKHSVKHSRNTSPFDRRTRLREKPVKELKAHDFKPNPAYNQGYSYAFSEAIRKRGDRMCLPGCTNPQCCGSHFRVLAGALEPLSAVQEEALLEEYLGDAYNTVMSTQMASDERTELILQARTKKMAKDNGKHKEAYERRRTPPGFWRVDFPTTQEQEDDRGRAKQLEIQAVQERWLEAQKKGGRWIFRDE